MRLFLSKSKAFSWWPTDPWSLILDPWFDENCWKIAIFAEISAKIWKSLIKICEDFELRAVQRCGNLVDFEKRCKMRPWTQKSALIQLRTSLLKFDDLAEDFERSSVSNFSTKALPHVRALLQMAARIDRDNSDSCNRSRKLSAQILNGPFSAVSQRLTIHWEAFAPIRKMHIMLQNANHGDRLRYTLSSSCSL